MCRNKIVRIKKADISTVSIFQSKVSCSSRASIILAEIDNIHVSVHVHVRQNLNAGVVGRTIVNYYDLYILFVLFPDRIQSVADRFLCVICRDNCRDNMILVGGVSFYSLPHVDLETFLLIIGFDFTHE